MKKLLVILLSLLRSKKKDPTSTDDAMWEHLDGAEFFVVPTQPRTTAQLD